MPSVRPEIIQATENNLPNAFLQPTWPRDIPSECPRCGSTMHPKINLSYGYGKAGRACQSISHWITLPWALLVLAAGPVLFGMGGNGGGFALGLLMILPAVIFAVITRLCPMTRRVQCFPCRYSKDYVLR